jgi:hypothetical protein
MNLKGVRALAEAVHVGQIHPTRAREVGYRGFQARCRTTLEGIGSEGGGLRNL